jgi:hypothetical protein
VPYGKYIKMVWLSYLYYSIKNFEEINKEIVPYNQKDIYSNQFSIFTNHGYKTKELQSIDDNLQSDPRFQ